MFLVEQHIPTADPVTGESIGEPFTGSDIRRVVYRDFCQERADQYADVANRVNKGTWCSHYTVRTVTLEFG
jgi:hypothetical protein